MPLAREEEDDAAIRYPTADAETPSMAVVAAFDRLGADPRSLDPPLGSQVDPEALDEVIDSAPETARVTARLWGRRVTVTPREVVVYEDAPPGRE